VSHLQTFHAVVDAGYRDAPPLECSVRSDELNSIIKSLSCPLEAFSRKIHRQLTLLVPKPQHIHCMQRTHLFAATPPHPSPALPAL